MREVKKFQTASGLTVDGICGPMTWAALDAAVAAFGSASGAFDGSASAPSTGSAQETLAPEPRRFTVHIPRLQRYEAEAYVASIPGAWMTEEGGETT